MTLEPKYETPQPPEGERYERSDEMTRRRVLVQGGLATGVATSSSFWFAGCGDPVEAKKVTATKNGGPWRSFTPEHARTVEAALHQILPSSGPQDPGAADVNAIGYVDALLSDPRMDTNHRAIFQDCAARLDVHATKKGKPSFADLTSEQQIAILKDFEGETVVQNGVKHSVGIEFFRRAVRYTLEAFFGDPVHGINTGEAGWKWIDHRPGYPRPTTRNWRPTEQ